MRKWGEQVYLLTRTFATLAGPGETSSSFSWFPQTPRSFVTGMNNRYLRIYDLRGL